MKIAIGTDHAGYRYKEKIKAYLLELGHHVYDFGTHSEADVDYPRYIRPVAEAVGRGEYERGIVLGGSGNGEAIAANRVPAVRCTLCWNLKTARFARKHNDANVLSLGARVISLEKALSIVRVWLETPFDGGRHARRIQMMDQETEQWDRKGRAPDTKSLEENDKAERSPDRDSEADRFDVLITFRYILYSEGSDTLEFRVDPGLKHPTVIHVPAPHTWQQAVPAWARAKRDIILKRLKEKCVHLDYEMKEY